MAAATRTRSAVGTLVNSVANAWVITATETTQRSTRPGKRGKLIVWAAGTGGQIDVYDHGSANSNQIYSWVTADGKVNLQLDIPFQLGLRVVTTGTAGSVTIVWRSE